MSTPVIWTLRRNGSTTKPLASWNITNPRTVFRNMDDDDLSVTIKDTAADIFGTPPFAYGDTVTLFRNAVSWFIGTVVVVKAAGSPKDAQWIVQAKGPWYLLRQTMYQQANAAYDNTCAKVTINTTKTVLYQDPITGAAITNVAVVQNAINYALSLGILVVLGTTPVGVSLPFETCRDLTISDVIRRALQPMPDAVAWFDYSGGVPIFNCQLRSLLAAVVVDFNASPTIIERFALQSRGDLVPSGVRFNYVGMKSCPPQVPAGCVDDTNGVTNPGPGPVTASGDDQVTTITQDAVGAPDRPNGIVATVDLSQLTATTVEAPPVGLAAAYYASLLTPQWEGSLTLREQECSGMVKVRNVVNLANGNPLWAGMLAVVQQVSENLATGETEITLGPPSHLAPQDFAQLVQWFRRRPLVTDAFAVTRPPGDGTHVVCTAGKDPNAQKHINTVGGNAKADAQQLSDGGGLNTKSIDVCEAGTATTVSVYGPPS